MLFGNRAFWIGNFGIRFDHIGNQFGQQKLWIGLINKKHGLILKARWYMLFPVKWSFELINFTYGTRTNADYTTPSMKAYLTSEEIYQSVIEYEAENRIGLNGFIMLIHIGTDPEREDKFLKINKFSRSWDTAAEKATTMHLQWVVSTMVHKPSEREEQFCIVDSLYSTFSKLGW